MNDRAAEKTMTVKEVAEQLGRDPTAIKRHTTACVAVEFLEMWVAYFL
jgi:predicted ArsR family transcriptional regulator